MVRNGKAWNLFDEYLENKETEKVEVGRSLELLEQIEGDEGQKCILGGLDEVVLKQIN